MPRRVTLLARVKDRTGRAVAVVSQHFEVGRTAEPEARLTFKRAVSAPKERGQVERVAYDHASGRATILRRSYVPSQ